MKTDIPASEDCLTRIYVKSTDCNLGFALARTLSKALDEAAVVLIGDPPKGGRGDIVVATDRALSPMEVAKLAKSGEQIVILAALPSETAEARYRSAGAKAYLAMAVSVAPLVVSLEALLPSVSGAAPTDR